MTDSIGLHDLVGSVAGAIVDAQAMVERHYLDQIARYFDGEGKPISFAVRLPRASAGAAPAEPVELCVPLLSLVESSLLAISELRIDLDVELGGILDGPAPLAQTGAPAGAPRDVPAIGPAPAADLSPGVAPPAAAPVPPAKVLAVAVGGRGAEAGPRARLSVKVEARPPSEGMLRLVTQLNKLI